ncbi:MAG TPA: acyl carrier protein, partial [Planctomycetota bacterium]|nr:acyl carrier protein [Planctomycetota bacterium]
MTQGRAFEHRGALRQRLAGLPAGARRRELVRVVCERAAAFLSRAAADVGPASSWPDLGFDSLRAVDFRSELEAALDLQLRSTLLFDQPSPEALAAHLLEALAFDDAAPTAAPAPRAAPAGAAAIAIGGAACR